MSLNDLVTACDRVDVVFNLLNVQNLGVVIPEGWETWKTMVQIRARKGEKCQEVYGETLDQALAGISPP